MLQDRFYGEMIDTNEVGAGLAKRLSYPAIDMEVKTRPYNS
ncbi:hypothetical protein [[Phormidium] sp. LEGE 05292]|nr:hypothetical protein [Phormidium sp. LEGE 05292]